MAITDDALTVDTVTPLRRSLILVTLTLVTMLYAMTVTIANVSLPQMKGAMSATTDEIALIITFNIIATAVATPMTGWLVSRFGRRGVMVWSVIIFTIASLMCGMADSLEALVFYRIIQGATGAPLVPLSQSIVIDIHTKDRIGFATAVFGMGVTIGPILAPTIGGYLSEAYSWRWVFFMIVPFGLTSLLGVLIFITDRRRGAVRLDWTGFIALSLAIATFQFTLDRGERLDWYDNWQIIICTWVAVLSFYIFISHSLTAEKPFLDPKLMLKRNFVLGMIIAFVFGMLNFTPITLLPSLLQGLRGYPDSVIGVLLAIRGTGTMLGFLIMFKASKMDPRWTIMAGFGLQGIAGFYMAHFNINLTMFDVLWTTWLQGLGVGLIWVPLSLVTFSQLDAKQTAEGSSIFHLLRNFGSSVFISVSIAIMLRTKQITFSDLTQFVTPLRDGLQFQDSWFAVWSMADAKPLAALSGEITRQATMIGYLNAFYAFGFTSFAVYPIILMIKWRR